MTLRRRLLLYSSVLLFSLVFLTALSLYSAYRYRSVQQTISAGLELQVKSRDVMGLMKDLVFEIFSPRLYGHVRSLTYAPRSSVTLRQWLEAVDVYMEAFDRFMDSPMPLPGRHRGEWEDQYETAYRMNTIALAKLSRMEEILFAIQALEVDGDDENLYNRMQTDSSLIPFFNEVQETSYYFTNSFESFMNYFIRSYREYGESLQRNTLLADLIIALVVIAGATVAILLISRDLLSKVRTLENAFNRVSRGDFSHPVNPKGKDELSALGRHFDNLSRDLKANVESILALTRNIASTIQDDTPEAALRELILRSVVADTAADSAGLYVQDPEGTWRLAGVEGDSVEDFPLIQADRNQTIVAAAARSRGPLVIREGTEMQRPVPGVNLSEHGIGALIAVPLTQGKHCDAVLVALRTGIRNDFTDLGVTRLVTFGEFAGLTIDHHRRYAEILEKGKAEYQALQSQVQPHFIYNVLSALFALNRQGDRDTLETTLISFREMLRYVQDGRPDTSIGEEFAFLGQYLDLQKLRFNDRLDYHLSVRPDTQNVQIPRLLLQPLVENAVIHGIEPLGRPGNLRAEAAWSHRDNRTILEIEIRDDGKGLPREVLEGGGRVGIPNVRSRLQLSYPGSRFSVVTGEDLGTKIRIEIDDPVMILQEGSA